jgi:hypothetical protein
MTVFSVFLTRAATFAFKYTSTVLTRLSEPPFQTHYFSENPVVPEIIPKTSGTVARNSDH